MRTYTADQIADYFLAKANAEVGDVLTNLKLQKLCYYAQGVALAVRDRALFEEPIEAWLHGPVVPPLYRRFKECGGASIPPIEDLDLDAYAEADRRILDDVYDFYGQYSAWRLRDMTHAEPPWQDAYARGGNVTITHAALREHFRGEVSDEYRARYEELSRTAE